MTTRKRERSPNLTPILESSPEQIDQLEPLNTLKPLKTLEHEMRTRQKGPASPIKSSSMPNKKYVDFLTLTDEELHHKVTSCEPLSQKYEYSFTGAPPVGEDRDCTQNAMAYLGWIKRGTLENHIKLHANKGTELEWIWSRFHTMSLSSEIESYIQYFINNDLPIPSIKIIITDFIHQINGETATDKIAPGQSTLLYFSGINYRTSEPFSIGHAIVIGRNENGDVYLFDPQTRYFLETEADFDRYFSDISITIIRIFVPVERPHKRIQISHKSNDSSFSLDELRPLSPRKTINRKPRRKRLFTKRRRPSMTKNSNSNNTLV